uniref:Uncharacterized protein n=1 Tax=Romanomermis culicivorax TaxID=13658 RepID=A0A915JGR0_ROMCU
MPEGLVTLGVSVVQIFASIFANLLFENARSKAADKIKGQMVHAENFRRVVQTDINEVKEKINSMVQSKIFAAYDYVKRGLIVLQGVAPARSLSINGDRSPSNESATLCHHFKIIELIS